MEYLPILKMSGKKRVEFLFKTSLVHFRNNGIEPDNAIFIFLNSNLSKFDYFTTSISITSMIFLKSRVIRDNSPVEFSRSAPREVNKPIDTLKLECLVL